MQILSFLFEIEEETEMITDIIVTCHRCGHTWTYMGSKIEAVRRGERSIRVQCKKCRTSTKLWKDEMPTKQKTMRIERPKE